MILELRLPHIERGIGGVKMVRWLKEPGEPIAPGDDIAVVDSEERMKLEVPSNAKFLSKLATARQTETRAGRLMVLVRLRLTAAEPATMRQLLAKAGQPCAVGDLLALLSKEPNEPLEADGHRLLRVVVNVEQDQ